MGSCCWFDPELNHGDMAAHIHRCIASDIMALTVGYPLSPGFVSRCQSWPVAQGTAGRRTGICQSRRMEPCIGDVPQDRRAGSAHSPRAKRKGSLCTHIRAPMPQFLCASAGHQPRSLSKSQGRDGSGPGRLKLPRKRGQWGG